MVRQSSPQVVRTRIAPSPTGEDIHIGNLYTALINFAVARKNKGQFIIRIEDTDRTRFVPGAEEKILQSIKAFGLDYDEGPDKEGPYTPYRQSERLEMYKKSASELVAKGHAYYCFCSKERLDMVRAEQQSKKQLPRYDKYCLHEVKNTEERIQRGEKYVIRLNVFPDQQVKFVDVIRGEIVFDSNQIDDQVLLKSDGYPTYHLGVVVDDHAMNITHIIRAEEWITSTPKHVLLYQAFGWELPIFAHVPILRNPDRSKLSKRKNPVWASWYLEQGFLPEAILNFLALMGWSHPEEKEIFSLDEFISLFDLKDVKPAGPIFDIQKLEWMNGVYIRNHQISNLKSQIIQQDPRLEKLDDDLFDQLLPLAQTRMKKLNEFYELTKYIFEKPQRELSEKEKEITEKLKNKLLTIEQWSNETILITLKQVMEEEGVKMSVLYKVLTGSEHGLPLSDVLAILGKERVLTLLS